MAVFLLFSARLCVCEGREGTAPAIRRCEDCGATACARCSGRPEHNFKGGNVDRASPQVQPCVTRGAKGPRRCFLAPVRPAPTTGAFAGLCRVAEGCPPHAAAPGRPGDEGADSLEAKRCGPACSLRSPFLARSC